MVASTKKQARPKRAKGKGDPPMVHPREPPHRRRHRQHVAALATLNPGVADLSAHAVSAVEHAQALALLSDDPSCPYAVGEQVVLGGRESQGRA